MTKDHTGRPSGRRDDAMSELMLLGVGDDEIAIIA
jgi:hypothetical protein